MKETIIEKCEGTLEDFIEASKKGLYFEEERNLDMNKPFTVAREEFEQQLVNLISNSGIPAIVLIDILDDKKQQLIPIAKESLRKDKEEWEAYLNESKEDVVEET